jgi:hypothetical protein
MPGPGGADDQRDGPAGDLCFEITNTGDTFLDAIRVVDERTTRAGASASSTTR